VSLPRPIEQLGLRALRQIDPERAHALGLLALRAGLAPLPGVVTSTRLKTNVAGLSFENPVGLAAGFDKNAQAIAPLSRAGFGFVEVGAITPRPQPGNPKPRLFRLREDHAVINRFGFNNEGMAAASERLKQAHGRDTGVPVGLNLGANKDSDDRAQDFAKVLTACGDYLDFATVNVSSPNTEKLRDLQGAQALTALLEGVLSARAGLARPIPIFLKIAPDLSPDEIAEVAAVAKATKIDGVIATNTTLDRDGLAARDKGEKGGLSGAPLFEKSTRVLAQFSKELGADIPLIGVGGISSAQDAYSKIKAGASLVQFYSAMVYHGISLAAEIARGLDELLARDGFSSVNDAIGIERDRWL